MFDPRHELEAFLEAHGVDNWVTGYHGQVLRRDDWADWYVQQCHEANAPDGADAIKRLAALRDLIDDPPDRKTITLRKVREVLDE